MALDKKDGRGFKRYSIDGCTVQSLESRFLGLSTKLSKKHMVLDISRGGVHFVTREKFREGKKVALTITAPVIKDDPIHSQGQVIRVKEMPGVAAYGVGIEFVNMDAGNLARLKTLIKSAVKSKGEISSFIDITASQK